MKLKANSAKAISDLKAKIKHVERQWEKSAYEIKDNIFAQAKVICQKANFNEVELDEHVVNRCIEVVLEDEDEENGN